jgi:hypothetical protein
MTFGYFVKKSFHPCHCPVAHQFKNPVADADPAHAVMNPSRAKPFLGNNKTVPLGTEKVFLRHPA